MAWKWTRLALWMATLGSACGGGPTMRAPMLAVAPETAVVAPRGKQAFVAQAGTPPYSWSLSVNASGGQIDGAGLYAAGSTPGAADVVTVRDAAGLSGTAQVTIGPGIEVAPAHVRVERLGHVTFKATGGSGNGWKWQLSAASPGGTPSGAIDPEGRYAAGAGGAVDDRVTVTDALGNSGGATVHVIGTLAVTPLFTSALAGDAVDFEATGASGALTWSLSSAPSRGAIDQDGHYVAGTATGSDVVRVVDEEGDSGAASIHVLGSPDRNFGIAPHAIEHIPFRGGDVLTRPTLVTIVWSDDPHREEIRAFGDFVMGSDWLYQTAAEYGLVAGLHAAVVLPDRAPAELSDDELQQLLADRIDDGTLPANPDGQNIYMQFIPETTALTESGVGLCAFTGGGYHYEAAAHDGTSFAYAVVSPCPRPDHNAVEVLDLVGSHELVEAISDPFPSSGPAYRIDAGSLDPWGLLGGENADLCSFTPEVDAGGHRFTAVFSNAASLAGGSPCVPPSRTFYQVSPNPTTVQRAAPGQRLTFTLTGWSSGPLPPWMLYTALFAAESYVPFMPDVQLGMMPIRNGEQSTLTVTVPANVPRRSGVLIYVGSYFDQQDFSGTLVGVVVP